MIYYVKMFATYLRLSNETIAHAVCFRQLFDYFFLLFPIIDCDAQLQTLKYARRLSLIEIIHLTNEY